MSAQDKEMTVKTNDPVQEMDAAVGEVLPGKPEMTVVEKRADLPQVPTDDAPYRRLGMFVLVGMLGVFTLWAAVAPLKSAVVAPGKVVVESRNKVVQHLDGGIVADIFVKEGDVVAKGQPLLKLSDVQIRAQLDIINSQWWEALANLARLQAERDGKETLVLSAQVTAEQSNPVMAEFLATQQQLFAVRRQAFHSEQSVLKQRIAQTRAQIGGLEKVMASQQQRASSLSQDVKDWQKLYEQQYADKVRLREMQRQQSEIEGDVAAKQSEVARLKQVLAETEHQMVLRQEEYLKEVGDLMRQYQAKLAEAEARKVALEDQLNRVDILAPESGRVVGFEIVTVGAVVEPRRPIMEIVPAEQVFAVMGQLQTMDVDQVLPGQRAEIKFTAFNTNYLPVMYGHVESIGADALMDEATKMPYYKVRVVPEAEAVAVLEQQGWSLVSGMPADTYIQTRERTLLNYIVKPFQVMFSRAFNEDDGL